MSLAKEFSSKHDKLQPVTSHFTDIVLLLTKSLKLNTFSPFKPLIFNSDTCYKQPEETLLNQLYMVSCG